MHLFFTEFPVMRNTKRRSMLESFYGFEQNYGKLRLLQETELVQTTKVQLFFPDCQIIHLTADIFIITLRCFVTE